jgi:hypothetical protein
MNSSNQNANNISSARTAANIIRAYEERVSVSFVEFFLIGEKYR